MNYIVQFLDVKSLIISMSFQQEVNVKTVNSLWECILWKWQLMK